MRNFTLVSVLILFLMLALAGCSSFGQADLTKAKTGYITDIDDQRILVNDTYFTASSNVKVVSDTGKRMNFSDLDIGVQVEPWFDGAIRESFPAQADVKKIVVIVDKDDKQVQDAVKAIVEYSEANYGKPVVFQASKRTEELFEATIAVLTLENPNPVTIRYDFATQQIEVE